jgi:hypothetical protein
MCDYSWASSTSAEASLQPSLNCLDNDSYIKIRRLLQCGTIFSLSEDPKFRETAYRIAIYLKNIVEESNPRSKTELNNYSAVLSLILSRLGNFPAEKKLISENGLKYADVALPESLWFERETHINENTVRFANGKELMLTDFQKKLWNAIDEYKTVIVNAPTSAGKSFVLQNHIIQSLEEKNINNVIYIVPTRALIEQVVVDLKSIIHILNESVENILITEVPNTDNLLEHNVFVLTQERVQLLLENSITIDLVVVDEAQNIADKSRGVILQSVIERIKTHNSDVRVVFATPFVKNPDVFIALFGLGKNGYKIIPIGEAPVSQNLYNITVQINDLNTFNVSKLDETGRFSFVCNLRSPFELSNENKLLAIIPFCIGRNQNSIIYASEPSNCEKIAQFLSQAVTEKDNQQIDDELLEFSEFIKDHIHKDYLLAETIKNSVAYHYGNLPSFIRKGIERLCAKGKIRFIVCTSTLLQGINLPAKNIFIMKPSKGCYKNRQPIPLDGPDFWNLAGRAGRLTKDFEGNIYLINLQDWDLNPLLAIEKSQEVYPSFSRYVCDPEEGLCKYIEDREHGSGKEDTQGLENTFMRLLILHAENRLADVLNEYGERLPECQRRAIIDVIDSIASSISLPYDIYSKNPNVSIYRQEEMYRYIEAKYMNEGPLSLIPPHPMQNYERIKGFYYQLFRNFDNILGKINNNRYKFFSNLSLLWMRGESYYDLLSSRLEYKNKNRKRGSANVNTEARGLFKDIEGAIRFKYVKYSKCYNDLLSFILIKNRDQRYLESIPPLHLFMELGGSSNTMVNLMGMGLSRTAAALIVPHLIDSNMKRDDIISWLSRNNIYALGLPQSALAELEQIK